MLDNAGWVGEDDGDKGEGKGKKGGQGWRGGNIAIGIVVLALASFPLLVAGAMALLRLTVLMMIAIVAASGGGG